MLPEIDGHLLSVAFIEQELSAIILSEEAAHTRRTLSRWRTSCAMLGPASTPRAMLQSAGPLFAALGFQPPERIESIEPAIAATLRSGDRRVALLVAPWGHSRDPLWRTAVTHAARRAAPWCLIFDGLHLRIVDAGRLYARRFLEIDLDLALGGSRGTALLLRLFGAAALAAGLDDPQSLHALVARSDRHATAVCRSLRDGVLTASADILRALVARQVRRKPDIHDSFEQALTIVYRMLFLLFAEARALVPLWHPIYRESYSLEALREAAEQSPPSSGLWDALRAISRLAHAGCRAGDLEVTPFNGRLFAPARTPLAERLDLDDGAARRAIVALSTRPTADRTGRERIAYRDLDVEQLGAVYETLLDYQPRIAHGTVSLETGSGARKATGSFYTPQPIADYLVRRALGPLVRDAAPDRILQLRIVDPAMGSGAFLVAACRFLAHAYESALVRSGACHASDIGDADRAGIRRTIAERCLYGVDLNPMAVQLARLSLWLATLAADRPLSFLDHRLQVGDSLLGTWLTHLRRAPSARRRREGHDRLPLFDDAAIATALREALPIRFALETTPNDTVDQVRAKERAFAGLTDPSSALSRWKRIAHVWCAAWFPDAANPAPSSAFGSLSDAALSGRGALPERTATRYLAAADAVADTRRFFHWELEFPEVFFDRDGARLPCAGFDAVIGNPPWDMIRADSGGAEARSSARLDMKPVIRFTRDSGVYRGQSDGHANRYQLFVERAIALTRPGGRLGLVLPSGLATDQGSASLRRMLFSRCHVDALVGMDNRRGVFPIHRSVRFLLVTASAGGSTGRVACRLDLDDPGELESIGDETADARFPVHVSPALLERISGPGLALPNLRSAMDLAIVERAASLFQPLGSADGWAVHFGRELNATDDRHAFRPIGNHLLPVVEGKHLEPFQVALGSVRSGHSCIRRGAASAIRSARAPATGLSRYRQRHESPDPDRGGPAATLRLRPHRVLPAHAAAVTRATSALRSLQQPRRQLSGSSAGDHACDHGNDRAAADPDVRDGSGGMPGDRDAGTAAGQAARRLGLRPLERQGGGAVPTERRGVRAHPLDVSAHSRDRTAGSAAGVFVGRGPARTRANQR